MSLINVDFCEKHHKDIELVVIEADALQNLVWLFSIGHFGDLALFVVTL